MEERMSKMSDTLVSIQQLMVQQGIVNNPEKREKQKVTKRKREESRGKSNNTPDSDKDDDDSDTTIYKKAIEKARLMGAPPPPEQMLNLVEMDLEVTLNFKKHDSSSSEDKVNTSDELMEVDINEQFIADCEAAAKKNK